MLADTKAKIEKHIRQHRKSGGPVKGDDDAERDVKDNPEARDNARKVEGEAEAKEAKKGGRMKRACGGMADKKEMGRADGGRAHHHAGRRHRASGGSCESNPFTSARKGTQPSGRKVQRETEGGNV